MENKLKVCFNGGRAVGSSLGSDDKRRSPSERNRKLADAWREYMTGRRKEFEADLELASALLREGTLEELAEFASRNVEARAKAAMEAQTLARD